MQVVLSFLSLLIWLEGENADQLSTSVEDFYSLAQFSHMQETVRWIQRIVDGLNSPHGAMFNKNIDVDCIGSGIGITGQNVI